jgi:drug/metabolite transporter (DMT)-like permease
MGSSCRKFIRVHGPQLLFSNCLTHEYITAGLALAGAALWGAGDFSGGIGSKGSNAFGVVVVAHGTGLVCMLALALATGEPIASHTALLWGVAAGFGGGLGLVALYRALAIGQMGINAPVAAVITGALPVLFGAWKEGPPAAIQIAGFGVALVAIWMIALPSRAIGRPQGIGLAICAGIGFGVYLICSKQAASEAVFWPLVSARAASMTEMLLIVTVSGQPWKPARNLLPYMMAAGVLDSLGNMFFMYAVRHGRLDVATVLSSLYPATTVLLARFVLRERISRLQTAGMVAALIAVPLIAAR